MAEGLEAYLQYLQSKYSDPSMRGYVPVDVQALRHLLHTHQLVNTPQTDEFFSSVNAEAAHQIQRWGVKHDEGKDAMDFFWLIGYLAGKAARAFIEGDTSKGLHHIISTAAALLNWHRRVIGVNVDFQPGHAPSIVKGG